MPTGLRTGCVRRVSLRTLAFAGLFLGGAGVLLAQQQPQSQASGTQVPALTQQATIAPAGFSLRYPLGWVFSSSGNTAQLVHVPPERAATASPSTFDQEGQILITTRRGPDRAAVVKWLEQARTESRAGATTLTINGWPAFQRREIVTREQPGDAGEDEDEDGVADAAGPAQTPPNQPNQQQPAPSPDQNQKDRLPPQKPRLFPDRLLVVTTVIAADTLLVRLEGRMPAEPPPGLEAAVAAISRSVTFPVPGNPGQAQAALVRLRALPASLPRRPPPSRVRTMPVSLLGRPRTTPVRPAAAIPGSLQMAGLATRVINNRVSSEPEIAVSTNGQNIVVAQGFGFASSNDGGRTFPFTGGFAASTGGDASLAFGRSGTFYEATINNSSTALNVSTDNGQTFTFRANAFTCPTTPPNTCPAGFPDQEHIAADRFNAAPAGGDQVYSAWRHLDGRWGLVCSTDSGQNWTAATFTTGDFPRVTVGQDGFVYIVYVSGNDIRLDRYNSCASGLTLQSSATVATVGPTWVQCPMAGLDRCNNGNLLSSHTVAVDDTNPAHIFVAYAQTTGGGNENVVVQDSTDAGATWPAARIVTVNGGVTARRFLPWMCAAGGVGYVSWFDRRAATATNNSLSDFFGGSVRVNASNVLTAGAERQINPVGTADNQCNAGFATGNTGSWPSGARASGDSTSCQPQPQLAGQCQNGGGGGSLQACSLTGASGCPAGETCQQAGGGTPKYGDYNGNSCAAGRVYTIWPSATTPPPTIGPAGRIDLYFASLVVAASQIQIPGPLFFPDTCAGNFNLAAMTANVCNTGATDLHVDPITSSDPEFFVTTPTSGFPVTIKPGSCFPFETLFFPTSPGPKSATLTVPSDDSVTPNATISVGGRGTQRIIATTIADAGDFGTVALGAFHDQPLVISNTGGCALTITSITSSAADFQTAHVVSFPLVIAAGGFVSIPIRFQPTGPGAKAADLTIASNDPASLSRQVHVTGTGGAARIVTSIADTGSFGSVCIGTTKDATLTISNSGTSPLSIASITSSSAELLVPQVLVFPIVIAPGAAMDAQIRFAPTTPGPKTATLTLASNDPATPNKVVTFTAETPDAELCRPPAFTTVGLSIGPTFGSSRSGDYTITGQGRHLEPFGEHHNFGVQAQGEGLYIPHQHEGQIDAGLVDRWRRVQLGVFSDFKFAGLGLDQDGGSLGQASAVLDVFFSSVPLRLSIFGSKGFKDSAVLTQSTSLTLVSVPGTAVAVDTQSVARVADTVGGGVLVGVGPHTDIDGNVAWLRRARPTPLSDRVGAMARVTQHLTPRFALFAEVTLNQTLVGTTNNGRVVFGFVFGRWTRGSDLASNKHTPLGTEVPRIHYDLRTIQR